jgi:hypothetical protein
MSYLIFILVALVLFAGFLLVTAHESRRGKRYAAETRASLDAAVDEFTYALSHTDVPTYVKSLVHALVARIAHDAAHAGLLLVRFLERLLTKAVRALRAERVHLIEAEKAREASAFVTQMKDFKDELRSARAEEPAQE